MRNDEYMAQALLTERTPDLLASGSTTGARLLHASMGLNTEAGEFEDALKKHLIYGADLDLVNVVEEIGDLLWYAALALDAAGSSFEEAMAINIKKLRARFPEGFTEYDALNRDLDTERRILEEG